MDKTALAIAIAGIAGVAVIAYILLSRRTYAYQSPDQPVTPPETPTTIPWIDIIEYELY